MRNYIYFVSTILFALTISVNAFALEKNEKVSNNEQIEKIILSEYEQFKFHKNEKISFEAFKYAYQGYINLLDAGMLKNKNILSICDFTLSSNTKRFWVLDISQHKVLYHTLVAHGAGTGEEFAVHFSNIPESHQSSQGFYITLDTYMGNNGYSLKLSGVDDEYNSNALDRAIVIHGAPYVSESFAKENKRLGRSHGCPALPQEIAPKIIDIIKDGTCYFIFQPCNQYLCKSVWINKNINPSIMDNFLVKEIDYKKTNPRYVEFNSDIQSERQNVKKVISSVVYIQEDRNGNITDSLKVKFE